MTTEIQILQFLHFHPRSGRAEISAGLNGEINDRPLKRLIANEVQAGNIIVEGRA